jgi:YD repeat-containing protein
MTELLPVQPNSLWAASSDGIGTVYRAPNVDFAGGAMHWESVGGGMITGSSRWGLSDPWHRGCKFVLTTTGLWKCANFWDAAPLFTLVADNTAMFGASDRVGHFFLMSINQQGFILVRSGRTAVSVSFDYGATWTVSHVPRSTSGYGTDWVAQHYGGTSNPGSYGNAAMDHYGSGVIYATSSYVEGAVATSGIYDIARSTDWGLTWVNVGRWWRSWGGTSECGVVHVPYKKPGGQDNSYASGSQHVYMSCGTAANNIGSFVRSVTGGTNLAQINSGYNGPWGKRYAGLHTYTHDSNYFVRSLNNSNGVTLHITNDAWASFNVFSVSGGGASGGVNGWADDPNILLVWGDTSLRLINNLSTSPTVASLTGGWSFANPAFVYAELDLAYPANEGPLSCGYSMDQKAVWNPISLQRGEKRETVTDLSINTAAGVLGLTRHYRQSKQHEFKILGLGWTHNHNLLLDDSLSNTLILQTPEGAKLYFSRVGVTNEYKARAGSTSIITVNPASVNERYTVIEADKSQYVFNEQKQLHFRRWPNNEQWEYTYNSGHLAEVSDGYGRKLVFRYNLTGQLFRVGDHTFDDTDPQDPLGRYVEYGYALPKEVNSAGAIVDQSGSERLLTTVKDARHQVWTYSYYGQSNEEQDVRQLNFLIEELSPSVDTTGDEISDGTLTRKEVTYTLQGIEYIVNGGMEETEGWTAIPGAILQINERSNGEVDTGSYSRYIVADALGQGIEGNSWLQKADFTYIITARVFPLQGKVKMQVPGNPVLDRISTGTGAWETLRAVYKPTSFATGQKIQFTADELDSSSSLAEFYVDTVSVIESDLSMQEIVETLGDGALETQLFFEAEPVQQTTVVTAGKSTIHYFSNGIYLGEEKPDGSLTSQSLDAQYRPNVQQDANGNRTQLTWSPDGKSLTQVRDALNNETQFTYDALDRLSISIDAEGRKTHYLYADTVNLRLPTTILVTSGGDLAVNGDMELDSHWTGVGSPTTNARSSTKVNTGIYSRQVVTNGANKGIQGSGLELLANRTYVVIAHVYVVSGVAKMAMTGTTGFDAETNLSGQWQTFYVTHLPTETINNGALQFLTVGGAGEFYVDSVHIFEGSTLLRWQTFTYDAKGRALTEAVIDPVDGVTVLQQTTRTYGATGNGNGLLESQVQHDLLDPGNNVATTYTYDSVGRVVKVQKSSLFGSCDVSYTVYDAAGHVLASICNYSPGSNPAPTMPAEAVALYDPLQPDKNRVTTHVYDALGRRVTTTTNAGAAFAQTTLTVYDALDRVIRTIANYGPDVAVPHPYTAARSAFDHGVDNTQNLITEMDYNARGLTRRQVDVLGNVTLYGYDDADRLIKTVQNASQPAYDNDYSGDPELSAYVASSAADQDLVTEQAYDAVGNLVRSMDVAGRVTYTVYDPLNRPVKVVRNAKDTATLTLNPGDSGYLAANDPRSNDYVAVSDSDRDQIETTEYDALGRVIRTRQLMSAWPELEWETTLYGYDALGRQVKVIRSASQPDYMLLADPDLSDYVASSAADLDLIQQTAYDPSGRVLYTEDTNGSRTWTAYDGLGRPVKTIANAVGTATDDSADDPRSTLYVPSGDADRDLISQTVYDSDGHVQSTEDALGRVTWMVYDSLGRAIRTVQNYLDVGEAPGVWEWHAGWTESDGVTPVDHGVDNDRNLVTETVYDAQGRVEMTFDTRHNATRFIYDSLGRRVLTISGYVAQGASDPADWLWSEANGRWEDGDGNAIDHGAAYTQNILSATVYDLGGRVLRVRDPLGIETRYEYDAAGRRVLTITNDVDGLYDPDIPDEDLNAMTAYDKAGQVVATLDARGTKTAFTYDHAGRRQTVTQAADTSLETTHYTCYDKLGRVLRQISNWVDNGTSPDARNLQGDWLFAPELHGLYADQNLITEYIYDRAGRRIEQRDPVGNATATTYFKDGQVDSLIDPEAMVTVYRYDLARRRNLVVQGYESQATDPAEWTWNALAQQWEEA